MNGTMKQTMQQTMNEMVGGMMNGMMNHTERESSYEGMDSALVSEQSNASVFSMAAIAGALLMCAGIVLYAIFTA